ncbi:MAG: T9SS type A sorting domain-containing protein [Saprospiraceae bacterium]|nr:T9SS type A sorting domain-containing protein [Saprospiraceae bacterium]
MKSKIYQSAAAIAVFFLFNCAYVAAQCTTWLHPAPPATYNDINNVFGGAPCDAGLGCTSNEIQTFEVFASEAYIISNFIAGGTYAFSICNGPGAGSWVPEFTILAPSGAVAAYGPGDGDGCTITWTAMESGSYKFIINEAGYCPGGPHQNVGNGHPAIRCISGAECNFTNCKSGKLTTHEEASVCGPDATFHIAATGTQQPATGGYGWYFTDWQGGTGGLAGGFLLPAVVPSGGDYNADLNGNLSLSSLPPLDGTWVVRGVAYKLVDNPIGSFCSVTDDSLVLHFSTSLPPVATATDNGNSSATATATSGLAPYSFLWSNGQTTETATDLPTGTYTVTVTDANGCTDDATLEVLSSTSNLPELASLHIAPNPTNGFFFVDLAFFAPQQLDLSLLDVNGRLLEHVNDFAAERAFRFDLSNRPSGVYWLRMQVGSGLVTKRIVLAK